MENQVNKNNVSLGWFLIASTIILGLFIIWGINNVKSFNRVVEVRGLCEREVPADRAIYPIRYSASGDNLQEVYASLKQSDKKVREFLTKNGIEDSEITLSAPEITDYSTATYGIRPSYRYLVTSTLTVYSKKVTKVADLVTKQAELVEEGIAVYNGWIRYDFEGLNDIKPEMIEEANTSARESASKFAKDSRSKVGKIKEARQGQFSIEDRDDNTPYIKKVRVVTNVTYYLK